MKEYVGKCAKTFTLLIVFWLILCQNEASAMVSLNNLNEISSSNGFISVDRNSVDYDESPLVTKISQPRKHLIMKADLVDLDKVSSLLSQGLLNSMGVLTDSGALSWKAKMEGLRMKADLQKQLELRMNTISIGHQLAPEQEQLVSIRNDSKEVNELSQYDRTRLLWSHDAFRKKLEMASKASSETNAWCFHNFALVPESIYLLQHAMISVKEEMSQDLIGFCEVAMLATPRYSLDCEDDICELSSAQPNYIPTIANVITSPSHRRQGVASRLIKSIVRYVRANWKDHSGIAVSSIGLYVDELNAAAISLYEKEGFVIVGRSEQNTNLLFMELSFGGSSFE